MLKGEIKKWFVHKKMIGILFFILLLQLAVFGWKIVNPADGFCDYQGYRKLSHQINQNNYESYITLLEKKIEPPAIGESQNLTLDYTDSYAKEEAVCEVVLKEIKQIKEYPSYLNQVMNMQNDSISIFQQSRYAVKDAEMTQKVFRHLQGVTLRYGRNLGCACLFDMGLDDVMCFLFYLLIAVSIITIEREEQTVILLRSVPRGQTDVSMAKYGWGLILTGIVTMLLYAFEALIVQQTYGLGDLSVPLQSIYNMTGSSFPVSVGAGLVAFFVWKLLAAEMLYSLFYLIAAMLRSSVKVYGVSLFLTAIEYVFFALIPSTSPFVFLRDVNLFSFWDIGELLGGYHNMKFFVFPVPYRFICIAGIAIIWLLTMLFGIFANRNFRFLASVKNKRKGSGRRQRERKCSTKRVLLNGEMKKCWVCQKGYILLAFSVLFVTLFSSTIQEDLSDDDKAYYKEYVKEVEGNYTEKKMAQLTKERERLDEVEQKMLQPGVTSDAMQIFQEDLNHRTAIEWAISYGKYLQENKGLSFIYSYGYRLLLDGGEGKWNRLLRNIAAVFLMIGLSVPVWGVEEWSGMNQLISVSEGGRRNLKRWKNFTMLINGMIVFVAIYLPAILWVLYQYGCQGILAPMQSMEEYSAIPIRISVAGGIVVFYFVHILFIWGVGLVSKMVQGKVKSHILSVICSLFLCGVLVLLISI